MVRKPTDIIPPYPGLGYILVKSREGYHWRRKRGTVKKAKLNPTLAKNAKSTGACNLAAKNIQEILHPFLIRLKTGRFGPKVAGKLKMALNRNGAMDYSFMKDYEFQPEYPLGKLAIVSRNVQKSKTELSLTLRIDSASVNRYKKFITGFFFDLILISGDPSKKRSLRIESDTSPIYPFDEWLNEKCTLSVSLPLKKQPWMLIIKASCHEEGRADLSYRYYGMKVLETGM